MAEFDPGTSPWIGGVVPIELVLARSDEAAVVLRQVVAYPTGFDFTIEAFLHRSVPRRRRVPFGPRRHHQNPDEDVPDDFLRVGLAWPDGGRATNVDRWGRQWPSPDETEPMHGLEEGAGGGSDREYHWAYSAWPIPADGELQFVVEWPAFGIEETATALDGTVVRDAAQRARPVWEIDADRPHRLSRHQMALRFRSEADDRG